MPSTNLKPLNQPAGTLSKHKVWLAQGNGIDCIDSLQLFRTWHVKSILQEKLLLGPWRCNPGTNMNKGY